MPTLKSVDDIVRYARELVEPFVSGAYVPDWERRSSVLSAISDFLLIRLRDDAFVEDELSSRPLEAMADAGYRAHLARGVRAVVEGGEVAVPAVARVTTSDAATLHELCSTLDYSEKVVMSGAAFAIGRLSLSVELLSVVANIFFEEAYHLKIVTNLLGLDQTTRPWLSPDKQANWDLVNACDDGGTYMLLEHVLFEARGAIAAAKGVHEARLRGVTAEPLAWLQKICNQETNHAVTGLRWFHRDGHVLDLSPAARFVVRRFIEQECDDSSGGFRTLRQRYSSWLLARYLSGARMEELVVDLKRDVARCQRSGDITPSLDDVSRSVDLLYERMSEGEASA